MSLLQTTDGIPLEAELSVLYQKQGMQAFIMEMVVPLLTTAGEEHTLALLMISALLSSHNITVINLGGEVPLDQLFLQLSVLK